MKVVCAWCDSVISDTPHLDNVSRYPITHGICHPCRERLIPQYRPYPLGDYLDRLQPPIIMVDGDGSVLFASSHALQFLNKTPGDVIGFKGGDVMECTYAKLPEGCGNTIHCIACTIRRNVMETFSTGIAKARVPAYLNSSDSKDEPPLHFLISTEKIGEVVLLRIDEVL